MKRYLIAIFALMLTNLGFSQQIDVKDVVEEVSSSIELNEEQSQALENQMTKYAISLQLIFDKYEQEEPDPQAMLTDIKNSQEEYHKALKADIGKEKFKAYEGYTEKVKLEILGEAAGLRLLDLQEPLKMTDDQLLKMKPIMAKAMYGTMKTLMSVVDAKMNVRTKLRVANSMKAIKNTMYKEMGEVLTSEQIKKWEQLRAEAQEKQQQETQSQSTEQGAAKQEE